MTDIAVSTIMLGVADVARSRDFYAALGAEIKKDAGRFVLLGFGTGSEIALYPRAAAAKDAGVDAEGSGFAGVSFHQTLGAPTEVDELIARAVAAGGGVVRAAEEAGWGGYFGYVADPDGFLWKFTAYLQ